VAKCPPVVSEAKPGDGVARVGDIPLTEGAESRASITPVFDGGMANRILVSPSRAKRVANNSPCSNPASKTFKTILLSWVSTKDKLWPICNRLAQRPGTMHINSATHRYRGSNTVGQT